PEPEHQLGAATRRRGACLCKHVKEKGGLRPPFLSQHDGLGFGFLFVWPNGRWNGKIEPHRQMIGAGIFASGNLRSSDFRAYEYLINWQADIGRERNRQQMRHPRAANTGHMAGAGSMFNTTDGIAPRCRIEITSDDQW